MSKRLELDLITNQTPSRARRRDDASPMKILLCADFSGRAARGVAEPAGLASRPILRVDIDNLDSVVARLSPEVEHSLDGNALRIKFASIDDFHPDSIFDRTGDFADLAMRRESQLDRANGAQTELQASPAPRGSDTAGEADLRRLLERDTSPPASAGTGSTGDRQKADKAAAAVDALIRSALGSSNSAPDQDLEKEKTSMDRATALILSERMRGLMQDPGFRVLEANWRTVELLVSRLDLDETLQLHLFDVTRQELAAASAESELQRTGIWKALADRPGAGDDGWSLVVSLEAFDASQDDISLLASLAVVAAASGAPLVASASPRLFGCENVAALADPDDWQPLDPEAQARWQALRESPLAAWIGLVAPALLLRLPYGEATDPIERFDFDEMAGIDPAGGLLWGAASGACALLAALAFQDAGWRMDLDAVLEIDDLPAWIDEMEGERQLYPCTGAWLGERASEAMLGRGIMPLLSRRDRPTARLLRWQSVSQPARHLAGPWRS
jgi:type VI secretion system protein ImpC